MTWKGINLTVALNSKTYLKGISLTKTAITDIENGLERHSALPKWDIFIRSVSG